MTRASRAELVARIVLGVLCSALLVAAMMAWG